MSEPAGCVRSLALLLQSLPPAEVEAFVLTPEGRAADELRAAGARILPIPAVSLFQNIAGLPVRGLRWGTVLRAFWQTRHDAALRAALRTVVPDLVHLNEHGMHHAAAVAHALGFPVLMHVRCVADRESRWQKPTSTFLMRRHVDQVVP
jgi:hypothetical protein